MLFSFELLYSINFSYYSEHDLLALVCYTVVMSNFLVLIMVIQLLK